MEILLLPLQVMGNIFTLFPPAAAVPGILYIFLFLHSRQWIQGIAASCWLLYAAYESAMQYGGLCSGECNIRVDLLVIYPILLSISLVGVFMYVRFFYHRMTSG